MLKRKAFQVVLAQPVPEEQQRIRKALEGSGQFHVCYVTHDGLDCLREVIAQQPDLVVLDMVLDKIDGLEVLRRLKEFSPSGTKCLVTSCYAGYLSEQALLAGADYCLLAPYSCEVLTERATQLLVPPKTVRSDQEIDRETVRVLAQMDAPDHLHGYTFTVEAVRIVVRDPEVIRRRKVTQEVYQVLADAHGIPLSRVERVMRTLTDHIFKAHPSEYLAQFFNLTAVHRGRITNAAFLSAVSALVIERLNERKGSANDANSSFS